MKVQVIIPCRLQSTRLPEKMIKDVCGVPLIVRTCQQVEKAGIGEIIVAVDDERSQKVVEEHGYTAIMTSPELPSGSDRIYAAMQELEKRSGEKADIIINVQGDEPLMPPSLITDTVKAFEDHDWIDVLTYAHPISDPEDLNNPSLVKLVTDSNNKAHYFSRSLIPHGATEAKRHIGFYAYKRNALELFVKSEQSPLEVTEKLEQLRGLDLGLKYYVAMTDEAPVGVDTAEDLEKVRNIVANS